jgi:hypothetical protein
VTLGDEVFIQPFNPSKHDKDMGREDRKKRVGEIRILSEVQRSV